MKIEIFSGVRQQRCLEMLYFLETSFCSLENHVDPVSPLVLLHPHCIVLRSVRLRTSFNTRTLLPLPQTQAGGFCFTENKHLRIIWTKKKKQRWRKRNQKPCVRVVVFSEWDWTWRMKDLSSSLRYSKWLGYWDSSIANSSFACSSIIVPKSIVFLSLFLFSDFSVSVVPLKDVTVT